MHLNTYFMAWKYKATNVLVKTDNPKTRICHYDYVKHKNNPVIYLACGAPLPFATCKFGENEAQTAGTEDYKYHSIGDQTSLISWCFEKSLRARVDGCHG